MKHQAQEALNALNSEITGLNTEIGNLQAEVNDLAIDIRNKDVILRELVRHPGHFFNFRIIEMRRRIKEKKEDLIQRREEHQTSISTKAQERRNKEEQRTGYERRIQTLKEQCAIASQITHHTICITSLRNFILFLQTQIATYSFLCEDVDMRRDAISHGIDQDDTWFSRKILELKNNNIVCLALLSTA